MEYTTRFMSISTRGLRKSAADSAFRAGLQMRWETGRRLTSDRWRRLLALMLTVFGNFMSRIKAAPRSAGLVKIPELAIGLLSVLLAGGLGLLGILDRINLWIAKSVAPGGVPEFSKALPPWMIWLGTIAFAFGISFAVLGVRGLARRVILWVSSLVVVSGWAFVLALAAREPAIGGPWIATFWAGFCAIVHAENQAALRNKRVTQRKEEQP